MISIPAPGVSGLEDVEADVVDMGVVLVLREGDDGQTATVVVAWRRKCRWAILHGYILWDLVLPLPLSCSPGRSAPASASGAAVLRCGPPAMILCDTTRRTTRGDIASIVKRHPVARPSRQYPVRPDRSHMSDGTDVLDGRAPPLLGRTTQVQDGNLVGPAAHKQDFGR